MNQLNSLKQFSKIVVDSGDISNIEQYQPDDVTTNPSLILQLCKTNICHDILDEAIIYAKQKGGDYDYKISNAINKIAVQIGIQIIRRIPGYISTEVHAKYSFNMDECIIQAKKIIQMYEEEGVDRARVLIKLAATWESIQAAKELIKCNIKCNLTLLFSWAQAVACAEAKVFLISPFVGRVYDWYALHYPVNKYDVNSDHGVLSVKKIFNYYKRYGYKTIIMGASFRNIEQILALSGCDRLTISPVLLEQLKQNSGVVVRQLHLPMHIENISQSILSESEFRWKHNTDQMAVEQLSSGIRKFELDYQVLAKLVNQYLL
ncbi:MAG: transaldolase [Buchnera aphidicola (Eriosoma harunire)]